MEAKFELFLSLGADVYAKDKRRLQVSKIFDEAGAGHLRILPIEPSVTELSIDELQALVELFDKEMRDWVEDLVKITARPSQSPLILFRGE